MDSDALEDDWENEIKNINPNTKYRWEKEDEEEEEGDDEEEEEEEDEKDKDYDNVDENENEPTKKKPKRVFVSLLNQEVANTTIKKSKKFCVWNFKSSCKLWKQSFIWMVKQRGYWVPVCWGWLPDKTLTSYKVFFLLIQKQMAKLGPDLYVQSVTSDFELNIMKSVDEMLGADILGCFFHLKKALKTKVDKKGFKSNYDNDPIFR